MGLVQWNTSYSVHVAAMDSQHKRLFDLINKLHNAMSQGKGRETLPEVFENLIQYTQSHFAAEEALLTRYKYPDFDAHKKLHDDLIAKVMQLQKQFLAGDLSISIQTRDFLQKWLIDHIKGSDQKYGIYLKQKGL